MTGQRLYRTAATLAAHIVLVLSAAGCDHGPATVQVSGKVLFKDGLVPEGGVRVVRFEPTKDSPAEVRKAASGEIRDDGSFELFTRQPGDGVFLGDYAVTFSVWKGPMEPTSLIANRYTQAATTPYRVKVEHDVEDLVFEIEAIQ